MNVAIIPFLFLILVGVAHAGDRHGKYRGGSNKTSPTNTTSKRLSNTTRTTTTTATIGLTIRKTTTTTTTTTTAKPPPVTTLLPAATTEVSEKSQRKSKVEVVAFCGDPGRPPRSQITPVQSTYMDEERVIYTCDEFISLKQYRKCSKGKWLGDTAICGKAFRDNDVRMVKIFEMEQGFPSRKVAEYELDNRLQPFTKFGNSFIAERFPEPVRAANATDYFWHLVLQRSAMIQMVRISFSVVNHLNDPVLRENHFDVVRITTSKYRDCIRASNNSVSPWHFNSTRFDYWYFCRAKTVEDFQKELIDLPYEVRVETSSQVPIQYDLATFILAEQYSNNNNRSDPICGLPEVPVGLEARVINDQTNYVFTCAKDFERVDNYGGEFQVLHCGFDNRWHGVLPQCHPVRSCPKFNLEDQEHHYLIEVYKYDRVYFVNETDWIPISGSRAFFRCKDETHIFVGKEIRICDNGEWTNSLPNCLVTGHSDETFKTSSILIIVLSTLIFTFILSFCSIYFLLKFRQNPNNNNSHPVQPGLMIPGMELSESGYYATPAKQIDEVYETVDGESAARYASYDHDHLTGRNNSTDHGFAQYSDASSGYPSFPNNDNYYDDTNVRPPYVYLKENYEVMNRKR